MLTILLGGVRVRFPHPLDDRTRGPYSAVVGLMAREHIGVLPPKRTPREMFKAVADLVEPAQLAGALVTVEEL